MTDIVKLDRREILGAGAGVFVLGVYAGFRPFPVASAAENTSFAPNVYVSMDETGTVTIVAHRSEMGTGIRTSLPLYLNPT